MRDNNYRAVEGILYNLPKLKVEIDNLKLDLEEANEIIGIRGDSGNEKAGSSTNAFSSVVENEVLEREKNLVKRIDVLTSSIQGKERQLKKIENALCTLTEQELLLIEMKYFKRYSISRICELLDITTATFNNRRRDIIVKRLIPIFFL